MMRSPDFHRLPSRTLNRFILTSRLHHTHPCHGARVSVPGFACYDKLSKFLSVCNLLSIAGFFSLTPDHFVRHSTNLSRCQTLAIARLGQQNQDSKITTTGKLFHHLRTVVCLGSKNLRNPLFVSSRKSSFGISDKPLLTRTVRLRHLLNHHLEKQHAIQEKKTADLNPVGVEEHTTKTNLLHRVPKSVEIEVIREVIRATQNLQNHDDSTTTKKI